MNCLKIFLFIFTLVFVQNGVFARPPFCEPGTYFSDDESRHKFDDYDGDYSYDQEECESGYYCPGDGTRRECPDGYFSEPGSEECIECGCKDGSICQKKTVVNETTNEIIQAGHCFNGVLCRAGYGYYNDEDDKEICYPCLNGYYSPGNDSPCLECPEHSLPNDDHSKCERCPSGTEIRSGKCRPCFRGRYYDNSTLRCQFCPGDLYQPKKGQTECIPCPEGLYPIPTKTECMTKLDVEIWKNSASLGMHNPVEERLSQNIDCDLLIYDKDEEKNKSAEL